MPARTRRTRGQSRTRANGDVAVTVWLSPDELAQLDDTRGVVKRSTFGRVAILREIAQTRNRRISVDGGRVFS